MNNRKNNKALKILTAVLAVSLIALAVFTFNFYFEEQENKTLLLNEKVALEAELERQKLDYEKAIAENMSNAAELIEAKERIERLLDSVKSMQADLVLLSKFRRQVYELKQEKETLFRVLDSVKHENKLLAKKVDSTSTIIVKQANITDSLSVENQVLNQKIKEGAQIQIAGLEAESVKIRNSGKIITTRRSRRANNIKICFTVPKNNLAQAGEKELLIQVIDPENNLLGKEGTKNFGEDFLDYSKSTKVYYGNENIDVCSYIENDDLIDGIYTVNIFENSKLLGSTTLTLK